jgi:hypothetical protein
VFVALTRLPTSSCICATVPRTTTRSGEASRLASPLRPVAPALTIHLRGCGGIVLSALLEKITHFLSVLLWHVLLVQTAAVPTVHWHVLLVQTAAVPTVHWHVLLVQTAAVPTVHWHVLLVQTAAVPTVHWHVLLVQTAAVPTVSGHSTWAARPI